MCPKLFSLQAGNSCSILHGRPGHGGWWRGPEVISKRAGALCHRGDGDHHGGTRWRSRDDGQRLYVGLSGSPAGPRLRRKTGQDTRIPKPGAPVWGEHPQRGAGTVCLAFRRPSPRRVKDAICLETGGPSAAGCAGSSRMLRRDDVSRRGSYALSRQSRGVVVPGRLAAGGLPGTVFRLDTTSVRRVEAWAGDHAGQGRRTGRTAGAVVVVDATDTSPDAVMRTARSDRPRPG